MKVYFYYKPIKTPWGGTNSFVLNLEKFLLERGDRVFYRETADCQILFLNSAYRAPGKMFDPGRIERFKQKGYMSLFAELMNGRKRRKVPIVYRLDGLRRIYAGQESPMDSIQLDCLKLADHVVFQSRFALDCFRQFGYSGIKHSIIHNGIDSSVFNMTGRKWWNGRDKLKVISCSWSDNPAKGHKMISDFSLRDDVEVEFMGRWPKQVPVNRVRCHGPVNHQRMAEIFKQSHILLFASLKEACSNTLLEALACGLPVLYVDSGSNKEIGGKYGVVIDEDNFSQALVGIKAGYEDLTGNLKRDKIYFSFDYAGEQYYRLFSSLVNQ